MKYFFISIFLLLFISNQAQVDPLSVTDVQKMIQSMYDKDQEIRSSMDTASPEDSETLKSTVGQMDQMHNIILQRIISERGYPDATTFGMDCTHKFWVLIMHQDADKALQESVLQWMIQVLPTGEVVDRDVAMLTDRVAVNAGECQKYGTQFQYNEEKGRNVPFEICSKRKMKKHRKKMRLKPFSQQAKEENPGK